MYKKKTYLTLFISLMLLSLASTALPLSSGYHRVSGYLYINDEKASEGIQVILSFDGEDLTDHTNENGHYQFDFVGHEGEEGVFTVFYMGEYLIPDDNKTVEITDVSAYHIDLHVTWTGPQNNPPDKPVLIGPEDGSTIDSTSSATLEVKVSDPDNDPMDVYFYDASDDSLIDKKLGVTSGQTASVEWTGLTTNTTYQWYAIANDGEYETKSDTWSFKTKKVDNKKPKVSITQPERGLYIFNRKILPRFIRPTLIIGTITVKANATDEDSGIEKVIFYINGKKKFEDTTEPYEYEWKRDRIRLIHIFIIKVVAYDNEGATAEAKMLVRKFL